MKRSRIISGSGGFLLPSICQIKGAVAFLILSVCTSVFAASDALDTQAEKSNKATARLLLDIERHQGRIFTVGEYGHILYSDDEGERWLQADVPTIVTLNAIDFPETSLADTSVGISTSAGAEGWAVGHDGIVLKSNDQGVSWHKQLDGFTINTLIIDKALQQLNLAKQQQTGNIEDLEIALEDAESFLDEGASRPLLDVLFLDNKTGFAVGAYGLIIYTRNGGLSWQSWHDHIDNPDGFHLNAIQKIGSDIYIVGEAGVVYRSNNQGMSWDQLFLPYDGSLFGIVGNTRGDHLVAFGLSGSTLCSTDAGANWVTADHGVGTTLSAGGVLLDGDVVLAGFSEVLLRGSIKTCRFKPELNLTRAPYSALLAYDNHLMTVGLSGFEKLALAHSDQSEK